MIFLSQIDHLSISGIYIADFSFPLIKYPTVSENSSRWGTRIGVTTKFFDTDSLCWSSFN